MVSNISMFRELHSNQILFEAKQVICIWRISFLFPLYLSWRMATSPHPNCEVRTAQDIGLLQDNFPSSCIWLMKKYISWSWSWLYESGNPVLCSRSSVCMKNYIRPACKNKIWVIKTLLFYILAATWYQYWIPFTLSSFKKLVKPKSCSSRIHCSIPSPTWTVLRQHG